MAYNVIEYTFRIIWNKMLEIKHVLMTAQI